jgi:hypothetical protein
MPEVCRFNGIVIRMYMNEDQPPHFHAYYAGRNVRVGIDPIQVIDGAIHPRARRMVLRWAGIHLQELLANWMIAERKGSLRRIEPLQ